MQPKTRLVVAYHGYDLDPPFHADPGHEIWVPLASQEQSEDQAVRDLMYEVALTAEEQRLPQAMGPVEAIEAFREALKVAQLKLVDDGSDRFHWFLLRWSMRS